MESGSFCCNPYHPPSWCHSSLTVIPKSKVKVRKKGVCVHVTSVAARRCMVTDNEILCLVKLYNCLWFTSYV